MTPGTIVVLWEVSCPQQGAPGPVHQAAEAPPVLLGVWLRSEVHDAAQVALRATVVVPALIVFARGLGIHFGQLPDPWPWEQSVVVALAVGGVPRDDLLAGGSMSLYSFRCRS